MNDIEMLRRLLQLKALTSLAFHPESSSNYVHLAGLLAYCIFNVFPWRLQRRSDVFIEDFPNSIRMQLTATGIAPDLHTDFPINQSDNGLQL